MSNDSVIVVSYEVRVEDGVVIVRDEGFEEAKEKETKETTKDNRD